MIQNVINFLSILFISIFSEAPSTLPLFLHSYTYEPEVEGIIRIMRKSDGEFLASIPTPPYFASHMVNMNYELL